jgi:hypothetical protein
MEKLIIDRTKWLRGKYHSGLLLNGGMCCLGFDCKLHGFTDEDIESIAVPEDIHKVAHGIMALPNHLQNSSFTSQAIHINDTAKITDADREAKLIQLFATQNIELEFIN